jgi:hypothetical protein
MSFKQWLLGTTAVGYFNGFVKDVAAGEAWRSWAAQAPRRR